MPAGQKKLPDLITEKEKRGRVRNGKFACLETEHVYSFCSYINPSRLW